MKAEILRQLKRADSFISGQELCKTFGVSRTAVWKAIRQLQGEGYEIEAVRNRGYRLLEHNDVISLSELSGAIKTQELGKSLIYRRETDSTNNLAKALAERGTPHGTLVIADTQTAGKGRCGRGWVSDSGTGIWMSLVLRPPIPPHRASILTLVAAMAVQKTLLEQVGTRALIKWPNDIVVEGRKICGILTEMSSDMDNIHYIVSGIGINVNQEHFSDELKNTATSLRLETGKIIPRPWLVSGILKQLEVFYDLFLKTADMTLLQAEYEAAMVNLNQGVLVREPDGSWTGIAVGINQDGGLLVRIPDDSIRTVFAGEVSVRGVYGYT